MWCITSKYRAQRSGNGPVAKVRPPTYNVPWFLRMLATVQSAVDFSTLDQIEARGGNLTGAFAIHPVLNPWHHVS